MQLVIQGILKRSARKQLVLFILLNNVEFVPLIPIPLGPNVAGVAHTPNSTYDLKVYMHIGTYLNEKYNGKEHDNIESLTLSPI